MAQAPGGEGGGGHAAPRQNKTVKDFKGMNTQNRRNAVPEGQFAWLENIQPIGPGNLHSIPGRSASVIEIPPPPPAECASPTPDPTELSVLCCYDKLGFGDLTGNDAGSLSFIDTDESWWSTESKMSGFGSGPYPVSTPTQNWYLLEPIAGNDDSSPFECGVQDATADAVPGGAPIANGGEQYATQTAQAGVSGKSDEKSYILNIFNMDPGFNIGGPHFTDAVVYFGESGGASYLRSSGNDTFAEVWAKENSSWWSLRHGTVGAYSTYLAHWPVPAPSGTFEDVVLSFVSVIPGWTNGVNDPASVRAIHYSGNYLYLLVGPLSGISTKVRVYRVNKTSFAYVAHWDLNQTLYDLYTMNFFVSSDDIIFVLADDATGSTFNIGYLRTSTGVTTALGSVAHQCTPAYSAVGVTAFFYRNGFFYISCGGAGGFGEANILKLGRLMCPSNPALPWAPPV